MTNRIDFARHSPTAYRSVNALHAALEEAVDPELFYLVYLRASQLNGCAYCTDMHSLDLQRLGVDLRRIFSVAAWRESGFYTERERAALELTEELTLLDGNLDHDAVERAAAHFSDKELSDLVLTIAMIGFWNRMAISAKMVAAPLATVDA